MNSSQPDEQKILILDWDVHHGDGTQMLLISDPRLGQHCAFLSIHRHDEGFWPTTGNVDDGGAAHPWVINVPLRGVGFGDPDYYAVFEDVVLPAIERLRPAAILVSAGYDCADGDVLGRFSVTPEGFGWMSRLLLGTNVPVVLVLEGGYDAANDNPLQPHRSLCESVAGTVQGLLAGPPTPNALLLSVGADATPRSDAPPSAWRNRVRGETSEVIVAVRARLGNLGIEL
jgi:acetoin utilization deacetylase AcuC-like enzyme